MSEVVRDTLRLLEEQDALQVLKLEALRKDIHLGLESLDNGQGKPLDMKAIKAKGQKDLAENGK